MSKMAGRSRTLPRKRPAILPRSWRVRLSCGRRTIRRPMRGKGPALLTALLRRDSCADNARAAKHLYWRPRGRRRSATDAELLDQRAVTRLVLLLDVVQQRAPLRDHL